MTNTTYYNLNIVEGTDIVNPLTVDNPNYEKIDEAMHDNAVAGVTLATEVTNSTIHAITRENSDCSAMRFIATSKWKAGDSVTVDGVPVLALLPSGETLPDGAYVINANVLCVLTGTNLTVYVGKSATDANEIAYNNTNVEAALNALNNSLADVNTGLSEVNSTVSTLTTGLEEVNSNLSKLGEFKMLAESTSTTEVTVTLSDDKISNYREIVVCACASTGLSILNATTIPRKIFELGNLVAALYYTAQGDFRAYATYISDTSLKISVVNACHVVVYGVK